MSVIMTEASLQLENLTVEERGVLALQLLQEQVVDQRQKLHYWRSITNQPAQIDTGYVAQHLVSLVTGVEGAGMRGKGEDLADGSEVKSANFLDALDRRGACAPRWNLMANDVRTMENLLHRPAIYLVSLDLNGPGLFRARLWCLYPGMHLAFRGRYVEWMEKLGKPKLEDPRRPYANFQLFPPRLKTDDSYARHGNGRDFARLQIQLEIPPTATKIFHGEEHPTGHVTLLTMAP